MKQNYKVSWGGKIRLKMGEKINYKQNKIQTKKKEKIAVGIELFFKIN